MLAPEKEPPPFFPCLFWLQEAAGAPQGHGVAPPGLSDSASIVTPLLQLFKGPLEVTRAIIQDGHCCRATGCGDGDACFHTASDQPPTLLLASSATLSKNFISLRVSFFSPWGGALRDGFLDPWQTKQYPRRGLAFVNHLPLSESLVLGRCWKLKLIEAAAVRSGGGAGLQPDEVSFLIFKF